MLQLILHDNNFAKKWGFPKITGTLLGGPIIRIIVKYFGLHIGCPHFGKLPNMRRRTAPYPLYVMSRMLLNLFRFLTWCVPVAEFCPPLFGRTTEMLGPMEDPWRAHRIFAERSKPS